MNYEFSIFNLVCAMFSPIFLDFWISTLLFAFIPGPAMLYVAGQTLAHGPKAGWQAAIGMHLGCYVHIVWAIASISLVMTIMPGLYAALRIAGAVYLLWIGFSMVMEVADAHLPGHDQMPAGESRSFLQSVWVEVLNPQTAVFYITQLPRFVAPDESHAILRLILLGIVVNAIFTLGDLASMACARLVRCGISRNAPLLRKVRLCGGSLIAGLGLHILLPPV